MRHSMRHNLVGKKSYSTPIPPSLFPHCIEKEGENLKTGDFAPSPQRGEGVGGGVKKGF